MRVFSSFLLIILLLPACRYQQIREEAPVVNELEPHSKFMINLPEDHRTGYLWQLRGDYDNGVIRQINEVWHGNSKGIDFNLKTMASGQTTLCFVLRKFTDTSDIKRFIVKIRDK